LKPPTRERLSGFLFQNYPEPYLGHITKKGTPAIQTTVRYTQVSREQVKRQLGRITG